MCRIGIQDSIAGDLVVLVKNSRSVEYNCQSPTCDNIRLYILDLVTAAGCTYNLTDFLSPRANPNATTPAV